MSESAPDAPSTASVRATAEAWRDAEPDADLRVELDELLAGADDELAARFDGRLQFGTAGLRGAVGAGPLRMNRLVVRQAAAGLVDHLLATVPDAAERGVLIGYDARRKSDVFALDTARVCAARGVRARLFSQVVPTPVLAWNITATGAAAGVMVTASHNPPADNGYKVYLGTGAQIVPPVDAEIAARIDAVDPTTVALAEADDPLVHVLGSEPIEAYLAAVPDVRFRPVAPPSPTRRCTGWAASCSSPRSTVPGTPRPPSWRASSSPMARSRPSASRTRRSPARWIG